MVKQKTKTGLSYFGFALGSLFSLLLGVYNAAGGHHVIEVGGSHLCVWTLLTDPTSPEAERVPGDSEADLRAVMLMREGLEDQARQATPEVVSSDRLNTTLLSTLHKQGSTVLEAAKSALITKVLYSEELSAHTKIGLVEKLRAFDLRWLPENIKVEKNSFKAEPLCGETYYYVISFTGDRNTVSTTLGERYDYTISLKSKEYDPSRSDKIRVQILNNPLHENNTLIEASVGDFGARVTLPLFKKAPVGLSSAELEELFLNQKDQDSGVKSPSRG